MLPFVVNDDHDVKQPMKILDFYPIPVGVVPLKRTLKDQEIDHVNILKNNTTINAGKNKISVDFKSAIVASLFTTKPSTW